MREAVSTVLFALVVATPGLLWLALEVIMRRRRQSWAKYARGMALAAAQYCRHTQRQFEAVLICLCWDHGGVERVPSEKLEKLHSLYPL